MIRINLLPRKTRRKAESGAGSQLWLVVLLLLFLAEVGGLFVFHGFKTEQLKDQNRRNAELKAQIDQAKRAVANHPQVKQQLAQRRARDKAIEELRKARTGPTAVLLELSRLITPGRGPSVDPEKLNKLRQENPLAVYNKAWDARRLWIVKLVEQNRTLQLEGIARDGEDVSELARRMNLSSYFHEVKILPGKKSVDPESKLLLVKFQLQAKVRY